MFTVTTATRKRAHRLCDFLAVHHDRTTKNPAILLDGHRAIGHNARVKQGLPNLDSCPTSGGFRSVLDMGGYHRASLVLGISKLWDFLSRMVGHLALRFPYVFGLRDMFEWGNPQLIMKAIDGKHMVQGGSPTFRNTHAST